jgi:hypothetical protein
LRADFDHAPGHAVLAQLVDQVVVVLARQRIVGDEDDDQRARLQEGLGSVAEAERRVVAGRDGAIAEFAQLQRGLARQALASRRCPR